jgi:hypothetical protein
VVFQFSSSLVTAAPAYDASTGAIAGLVSILPAEEVSNASVAFIHNATGFRYITTSDVRKWWDTYL